MHEVANLLHAASLCGQIHIRFKKTYKPLLLYK